MYPNGMVLTIKAPAKVNLRLKITGRRPDGYHLLDMVMVKLDLFDEIDLKLVGEGVRIKCDDPHLKIDPSNTVWRAADLVREESGKKFGLDVTLRKKIPVAAGLGGGSSDAAATLKALNSVLEIGWDQKRLVALGSRIGADVPFFLAEGPQKVSGIGEVLEPVDLPPLYFVLINPGFPVSTAEAYRWFDEESLPAPHRMNSVAIKNTNSSGIPKEFMHSLAHEFIHGASPLTTGGAGASFPPLENDLERVVIPRYPVLARIKEQLIEAGALGALMSGSGSTVFGLFDSRETRDRGYEKLRQSKDSSWWVWKANSV